VSQEIDRVLEPNYEPSAESGEPEQILIEPMLQTLELEEEGFWDRLRRTFHFDALFRGIRRKRGTAQDGK
jgi:hypothetical protein